MQKKKKQSFLMISIIILAAIALFSLFKIGTILYGYYQGTRQYSFLEDVAAINFEEQDRVDFAALQKENEDIIGWIYSEDTVINYPIVIGEDNDFYLYRTALKEWNGKGSIFVDYRCEKPFEDFNTILYGHRMKDGSMFHSLTKYDKIAYYKEHPVMQLMTPEENYNAEVFAAVRIPSDSSMYRWDFENREEKEAYLAEIKAKSLIDTGVSVTAKDRIVMMSTCTYEFEEARMVVFAKLTECQ